MNRRIAAFLAVSALLGATVAWATNPPDRTSLSERELIIAINGKSVPLGAVFASVDGGAFSTCVNTATPKDAGLGDVVGLSCSADMFVKLGDCTTTASGTSRPVAANTEIVTTMAVDDMAVAFLQQDAGTNARCYVGHMQ